MKLQKPPPKCGRCGRICGRNSVHCYSVLMNGCDFHFCLVTCWPEHSKGHDLDWLEMTEAEQDTIIENRADNG